jgi:hypothetical protein
MFVNLLHQPTAADKPTALRSRPARSVARSRLPLLLPVLVLAILACSSVPALALPEYAFTGSFGAAGAGPGQFKEPTAVAVDEANGDVYVVDQGNNRVEYFTVTGEYIGQFTGSASPTGAFSWPVHLEEAGGNLNFPGWNRTPGAIAVDNDSGSPSFGDVYVADTGHHVIDKFSATGEYKGQLTGTCENIGESPPCLGSKVIPFASGEENVGLSLAVDPSGNLWVNARSGNGSAVDEFSDTGSFRGTSHFRPTVEVGSMAVDSNDDVYVDSRSGSVLSKWEAATGVELAEFSLTENSGPFSITALALDPLTNDLYVVKTSSIEEYGPFGEPYSTPIRTFGAEGPGALSESHGIAVDDAGAVYATESQADKVEIFTAGLNVEAASGVEETGTTAVATLNGNVNPENITVTSCEFEYVADSVYQAAVAAKASNPYEAGATASCSPSPGSGASLVAVSASLSGLPLGTYDYRLAVEDSIGRLRHSGNEKLVTPSAVDALTADAPSSIKQYTATFNGSLIPDRPAVTSCEFEYGIDTSSEHSAPCAQLPGAGTAPVEVHASVAGLQPNTLYHYRLSATNVNGTTTTPEQLFHTLFAAPAVNDRAAFASEVGQFSAVLNGEINPENALTSYRFVYGPTSAYGSSIPVPEGLTAVNYADDAVGEPLADLRADTTYHFALVAANAAGTVTGPDETFTTASIPALPSTGAASDVTRSEALLSGTIDPQGWSTSYQFQYGTSTAYGSSWPSVEVSLGAFTGAQPVEITVENLQPGTTYHYRLVATSIGGGTSYGSDMTFTTAEYPVSVIQQSPLLTGPPIMFPTELGTVTTTTGGRGLNSLTRAQKLAKALKACKKQKQSKRAKCEKQARSRYGAAKKTA